MKSKTIIQNQNKHIHLEIFSYQTNYNVNVRQIKKRLFKIIYKKLYNYV